MPNQSVVCSANEIHSFESVIFFFFHFGSYAAYTYILPVHIYMLAYAHDVNLMKIISQIQIIGKKKIQGKTMTKRVLYCLHKSEDFGYLQIFAEWNIYISLDLSFDCILFVEPKIKTEWSVSTRMWYFNLELTSKMFVYLFKFWHYFWSHINNRLGK